MNLSIRLPTEEVKVLGNLDVTPMFETNDLSNCVYINDEKVPKALAEYILIGMASKMKEYINKVKVINEK